MKRRCNRCGRWLGLENYYKNRNTHTYCKECSRLCCREYYNKNKKELCLKKARYVKRYREKYRLVYQAHCIIKRLLEKKEIAQKPCEICNSTPTNAHHDDYKYPYKIRWLCSIHHKEWHLNNTSLNRR